jgi:hypothetical protein
VLKEFGATVGNNLTGAVEKGASVLGGTGAAVLCGGGGVNGSVDGRRVGSRVGNAVGSMLGSAEGISDGADVGLSVGSAVGVLVLGVKVGEIVGSLDGITVIGMTGAAVTGANAGCFTTTVGAIIPMDGPVGTTAIDLGGQLQLPHMPGFSMYAHVPQVTGHAWALVSSGNIQLISGESQ